MNYASGTGLRVIIYLPSYIKIGLDINKVNKGDTYNRHRQKGDLISLITFS
jgi:hypothetical protein